eukprot:IDg2450t1
MESPNSLASRAIQEASVCSSQQDIIYILCLRAHVQVPAWWQLRLLQELYEKRPRSFLILQETRRSIFNHQS